MRGDSHRLPPKGQMWDRRKVLTHVFRSLRGGLHQFAVGSLRNRGTDVICQRDQPSGARIGARLTSRAPMPTPNRSAGPEDFGCCALQANGETRSVVTASSIRTRSVAWTILLDWTYRSRRSASVLWTPPTGSCACALELGLELCPAEVGPVAYKDQPLSGWLIIAMNVITVSVGGLSVFRVEHDDRGLWLSAGYGHAESFWGSDKHFVFVRPVSSSLKV
jgi:hypothetical protein